MSLDRILSNIENALSANPAFRDISPLRELVAMLRPQRADSAMQAADNLRALCYVLQQHPAWRSAFRLYLIQVLTSRKTVHLLTDIGITHNTGFWSSASRILIDKILPSLVNDDYVKDIFGQIFDRPDDHIWVNSVSDDIWQSLVRTIGFRSPNARATYALLVNEILSAVQVLSYRITHIGLEAELVRNHPEIEQFESP
ncbi:MAG: hypothetical protein KGM99_03695, partial [Burkholderiales bacterium]|nr:hypothetical protein [Burkholderiales bacterium]